ncbi:MAG: hypothetical protein ACPKPY_10495 [Nitrososphaeraceae archaeon]
MARENNSNSKKKVIVEQLECNRCNYKWYPRINPDGKVSVPKNCANRKCKSPYWNKKRVR